MNKIQKMDLRSLSIQQVLDDAEKKWGERDFIWAKKDGKYTSKTFSELAQDVRSLAEFLLAKKLRGKQIAILSDNSYEFMVADLAAMGYVGVSATLNSMWGIKDTQRAMKILEVKVFFYDTQHESVARSLIKEYPTVEFIKLEDIPSITKDFDGNAKFEKIDTAAMSKIIFSSGTTSQPKAVMMSQRSMFAGGNSLLRRVDFMESDVTYNFLPLCHTYGGIYSFLYSLVGGCQIYLCTKTENIPEELKEVKPTVFSVVPKVLEVFYSKIDDKTKAKAKKAMKLTNFLRIFKIDIRKKVFKELHEAFGGNLKYLFCAGAKLDNEIKKFFKDAGINLLEAYALTETASSFALEYPGSKNLNCVGTIYEDIKVKIDHPNEMGVGEILVKGDNVCLGYYKNQKANEQAFTEDGYFRTKDLGRVSKTGELFLFGRKKRVILRSNGVNVYPEEIEQDLQDKLIKKVKVYEENHKIIAELFVIPGTKRAAIDKLISAYNHENIEYWKIDDYEIIQYDEKARLK